jgi:hypothetical protein
LPPVVIIALLCGLGVGEMFKKVPKAFEDALVASAYRRADAMDEAWELLESQRSDVAESFKGADHATGEQGANFAYMGYVMAMDKLRSEAKQIRG